MIGKSLREHRRRLATLILVAVAGLSTACTVVEVAPSERASVFEARGLVDGYLALGLTTEDRILNVSLLDGSSPGSLFEVVVWKLLRVEAGLAGASVGVLPLHAGVGVAFYDPRVPEFYELGDDDEDGDHEDDRDECHPDDERGEHSAEHEL